jgi:transcriptional regulator with XRE-family HTH domain
VSKTKFSKHDEAFRELLKELRTTKGLNQGQVAARLGVPQSYVSKYETGERRLDFVETAMVCEVLGVGLEQFAKEYTSKLARSSRTRGRGL